MLDVTSKSTKFSKSARPDTESCRSCGEESIVRTRRRSTEAAKACGRMRSTPETFWNRMTVKDLSLNRFASKSPNIECLTTNVQSWLVGKAGSKMFCSCSTLFNWAQVTETALFSDEHSQGWIKRKSGQSCWPAAPGYCCRLKNKNRKNNSITLSVIIFNCLVRYE